MYLSTDARLSWIWKFRFHTKRIQETPFDLLCRRTPANRQWAAMAYKAADDEYYYCYICYVYYIIDFLFLTVSKTVCFSTGVVKACAWRPVQLEFELICGSMLGSYVLRFWKIQYRKVESCCASRDIDLTSGWEKWIALWLSAAAVQAVSALLLVHVLFILVLTRLVVFLWLDSKGRNPQIYWNWNHTFNHPVAVVWQRCGSGMAVVWHW